METRSGLCFLFADNTPTILSHPLNRLTKSNPAAVEAIIAPTHDPHLWHETRSL